MSSKSIENTEQVRELERAILGGLMLETERYDAVSEIIAFSDFEGQDHQNIFQSMGELVNSNKPLDPLTVSDRLDSKNLLTRAGGKNYLIDLASTSPSAANLEAYAGMVRQKSISRRLMKINSEISELIINPQGKDAAELLDEAETKIFSLNLSSILKEKMQLNCWMKLRLKFFRLMMRQAELLQIFKSLMS